jgi:hypothetical protein
VKKKVRKEETKTREKKKIHTHGLFITGSTPATAVFELPGIFITKDGGI